MRRLPPNATAADVTAWMAEYDAQEERAAAAGLVAGRHFTAHVEKVKALKRAGQYTAAETLLVDLLAAATAEAHILERPVPPWYDDQLRIVRKRLAVQQRD